MRLALLLLAPAAVLAFVPAVQKTTSSTKLDMERRDVLITGIMGLVAAPGMAQAVSASSTFFYDDKIEQVKEASQMPTGGKLDLNSAFVGEYKNFPGMFPHAAGMIASHGPYDQVSDIYKIDGITANDKKMFKKYDKYFTVNPPDPRSVDERINARVST